MSEWRKAARRRGDVSHTSGISRRRPRRKPLPAANRGRPVGLATPDTTMSTGLTSFLTKLAHYN